VLLLCSSGSFGGLSGKAPALPAGYHQSSPPPRITSGLLVSRYCRAISLCSLRCAVLEKKAAGEASVTWAVVTRPVALPASLASRPRYRSAFPAGSTLIAPL
jgi:hypothetical protein